MKYPPHPGPGIRYELDELGLSVSAGARALGVSRQQLHNLLSGKSSITAEMAVRLEKSIGSTADTWLRMQMAYDLAQVRLREDQLQVKRVWPAAAE